MLFKTDLDRIRIELSSLDNPPALILHPAKEDSAFFSQMTALAEELKNTSGGLIEVGRGDGAGLPGLPGLTIEHPGRGKINYLALPFGPEEAPFFETLLRHEPDGTENSESKSLSEQISSIAQPAELIVFIASACPHCPGAVRVAASLALSSPKITATIIDAQLFPELAERHGVKSVPLTILDGDLSLVGVRPAGELVQRIIERGTGEHGLTNLMSLIEQDRLDEAADFIQEGGQAHFVSAWLRSTMSSRIALILITEEILDRFPSALEKCVEGLFPALRSEDTALRGDTADLLGRIGHPSAVRELEKLLDDANPDVSEMAADALDEIREKS